MGKTIIKSNRGGRIIKIEIFIGREGKEEWDDNSHNEAHYICKAI